MKQFSTHSAMRPGKGVSVARNGLRVLWTTMSVVISLVMLTGYSCWPRSPLHLGEGDNMSRSGLYDSWKKGEVVVLMRHGERCDRSTNECLGPEDGITHVGSAVSRSVGGSINALGLAHTDVLSSPATRTAQTAQLMVGHPVEAQDWLYHCDNTSINEVMAHKAPDRNLILVTHSGCISRIESQQGFPHADMSEYDGALFISLDGRGQPVIRGIVNPDDWRKLASSSL